MRRAAKRDLSEEAIVKCLRLSGWSVQYLSIKDGPDLLLGKNGLTLLAETKTGTAKLRPGQKQWHDEWRGSKPFLLRDVEDVLALNQSVHSAAFTAYHSPQDVMDALKNSGWTVNDFRPQSPAASTTSAVTRQRNGKRIAKQAVNE